MTVAMERDFDPAENFPSVVMDALQRMLTALGDRPCQIRLKPGAANTLQVPGGTGDDASGLIIDGHWRWNEAAAEVAGSGSTGARDVWAVTDASVYTAGSPGETDSTDRSFSLRITAVDAAAPSGAGIAHTRRIARAWWSGTAWLDVVPFVGGVLRPGVPPLVDALPTSPYDGQEIRYVLDATKGAIATFRYRAASASSYKWERVGGSPLAADVANADVITSDALDDASHPGPAVTLPLAGDWDLHFGAQVDLSTAADSALSMAPEVGGVASTADAFNVAGGATSIPIRASGSRRVTKTGVSAGVTITAVYSTIDDDHSSSTVSNRWLRAIPIRVG